MQRLVDKRTGSRPNLDTKKHCLRKDSNDCHEGVPSQPVKTALERSLEDLARRRVETVAMLSRDWWCRNCGHHAATESSLWREWQANVMQDLISFFLEEAPPVPW